MPELPGVFAISAQAAGPEIGAILKATGQPVIDILTVGVARYAEVSPRP